MGFFRRELDPVERCEEALRDRQAARQKALARLNSAEAELVEKRRAAEQLAVQGASDDKLARAEAKMRAVEDRARTLRAALAEADDQVALAERARDDAVAQRERELLADRIEAMAGRIEGAAPGFRAGAASLVEAVAASAVSLPEGRRFSANVEAAGREVLAAADLLCWELRTIAARTRAGNANLTSATPTEPEQPSMVEAERVLVYTLNALLWREGGEVRKRPAFALVELPKPLLPAALRLQHVDHLSARRVQTLMHVHGSSGGDLPAEDAQFIDLDVLATEDNASGRRDVA